MYSLCFWQTSNLDIEGAIKILKAEGAILASKKTDKGAARSNALLFSNVFRFDIYRSRCNDVCVCVCVCVCRY